jgi:DNA-binding LacI/PurR family transcriptional regulator
MYADVLTPSLTAGGQGDEMARVTLQTIADRVGVSRMTVSNAFSRPDQLSGALRRRILAAAEELGYVGPDPAARALVRGTVGTVGVLLTDSLHYAFSDEVATRFLGAVADELAPTGLALTLLTADGSDGVVPARDVPMDGALVYSCRPESAARDWLLRRKLPLVFVDQDPVARIPSVNVDDRSGARLAAQHLLDLGHRRIGIVTLCVDGPCRIVTDPVREASGHPQTQRTFGWLDALTAAGVVPAVVQAAGNSDDDAVESAELLFATERPTAVLCFSDVLAMGVLRYAEQTGLAVPHDLSLVGFDDSPVARRTRPPLTTVRQDVAAKGRAAAAALTLAIERARSGSPARARHQLLPTTVVVRESTAPPPLG